MQWRRNRSDNARRGPAHKIWVTLEIVIFLAGLALIIYPWWDRTVQQQKQLDMLLQWDEFIAADVVVQDAPLTVERTDTEIVGEITPLYVEGELMIGTISVSKIDLIEPMFAQTTEKTLKLGIGSVVPGVLPGDQGNLALAGHRSRTFGKQFNRLDELEAGDTISIQTSHQQYVYEVSEKFLVKPDEMHVLDQQGDIHELTLITCEPSRNPTHRLIVKAQLFDESIENESTAAQERAIANTVDL